MPITVDAQPIAPAWKPAVALAVTHRPTGYAAFYLELARRGGLPLAGFDAALRRVAAAEGVALARLLA